MKQIIVDNQVTSYFINETGKCFNSKTNKYLKGQISNSGYLNYNLSITPQYKKRLYAHRLVAQYFLNNGEPIEGNKEVNHKDGNKLNNSVSNLEFLSHKNNIKHAVETNLIKTKPVYSFNENLELVHTYKNIDTLLSQTKYNRSSIVNELNTIKKKQTYGYYWSYENHLAKKDIIKFQNKGVAKTVYQYSLDGNKIGEFHSTGEAGRMLFPEYKRAASHIGECCRGRIKTYKGFIWKYKEDIV